jgi:uncharacterized membrane protein
MFLTWVLFALHLVFAALWVGGLGFAWLALRPSMAVLEPAQRLALHRAVLKRFFLIVWHAIVIMFVTGYWLVKRSYGSMAASPPELHAMVGGWGLMTLVFLFVFFVPWKAGRAALEAGNMPAAAAAFGRIRQLVGVNLLLGLLTIGAAAWES